MASGTLLRIPIIDFSHLGLRPGSPEWETIKLQVQKALEEYGCFEAIFVKVSSDLRKALFGALEELFDLPLETKVKNSSKKPFHGYVQKVPKMLLFESLGIDDANVLEGSKASPMSCGQKEILNSGKYHRLYKTIQTYSEQISELDLIIRRMVVESYGVEKYFDENMNLTNYLLRVMKIKVPETTDAEVGLLPHTDMNMLTILSQNHVDGLQVQTKDGEWIDVKPSANSFTVVAGDAFYAWTNGRLHSPAHRVMMRGRETRYSTGLFAIPKSGHIIKAPEELVDEEHPLLFNPYDHVEFLVFFYAEAHRYGTTAQSALKTFCGV